ncbi:MAG: methyltransferase domain-containing protein [Dehalococcoidia bacterium]|nr:methyltransferase domain-containing protein [Dehalococcoidia bacterium]
MAISAAARLCEASRLALSEGRRRLAFALALARGVRLLWLPRGRYKEVWNSLSGTEELAKISVLGHADEAQFSKTAEATRDMLIEHVGIHPSDRVLEIGAGVGRVGAVVAPLCREWTGADVADNMLRHIRNRLAHLDNVHTLALNGYDLGPVASASVDLAYCTVVFMHLDEWDRYGYIHEGFRVLRLGGRMLIDNFNLTSDEGWAVFQRQRADYLPGRRPPHIARSSTPQELATYFQRAGFEAVQQRCEGLWAVTWGRKPAEGMP